MSGARNAKVAKLKRKTDRFLEGQPASAIPELRLPAGRSVLQYFFICTKRAMTGILLPKRQLSGALVECNANLGDSWNLGDTRLYHNCIR